MKLLSLALGALLVLAGCGGSGGGGGGDASGSNISAGIYVGTILDEDGDPVAGAVVSIDGIQACAVTGPDGSFRIEDPDLAVPAAPAGRTAAVTPSSQEVELSVLVPGYEPRVATLVIADGEWAEVDLVRTGLEPHLTISSPTGTRPFVVPASCANPRVLLEGYARLSNEASHRLDVVLVIDRSGSTARDAFDLDDDGDAESVLEIETSGASDFVRGLDATMARVAVVAFNDEAELLADFSADFDAVIDAIGAVGTPAHGTNYEAALMLAAELFQDLGTRDEADTVQAEEPAVAVRTPYRAVVFLSDGIPTSHGIPRDGSDSNLTQSADDRHAAADAAQYLGEATGAELFAFSIIPADDANLGRTTLPHCVALCGGGRYENVSDPGLLDDHLCGEPLNTALAVEIANLTTGDAPIAASLYADGFFSTLVPVSLEAGEPLPADPDVVVNQIAVTLTAFSGAAEKTATEIVAVRMVPEAVYADLTGTERAAIYAAAQGIGDVAYLEKPTGGRLGDDGVHDFLREEFEDAVELYGVETFRLLDPEEGGAGTMRVEFVYKQACYRSDFGYIFIDPENPPRTAAEALAGIAGDQIFLNSGDVGASTCNLQSIAAGTASHEVAVPAGGVVVFFILPNRTLAQYQASPRSGPAPLFTYSALNPGRFDQVLTFRSLEGRTEPGAGTTVVSPGPLLVFAFEDLAITNRSDQDFSDVVFTVTSVQGRMDSLQCE